MMINSYIYIRAMYLSTKSTNKNIVFKNHLRSKNVQNPFRLNKVKSLDWILYRKYSIVSLKSNLKYSKMTNEVSDKMYYLCIIRAYWMTY